MCKLQNSKKYSTKYLTKYIAKKIKIKILIYSIEFIPHHCYFESGVH